MEFDREVVNLRLARIEDGLGQLEPFAAMSELQFLARYDRYLAAKQILAASLNTVAQVARHLQRSLGKRNDDTMTDLVEAGILPGDLADRLRRQLRLLTTLSRAHFDEDRDIVYEIITNELADLALFSRAVTVWMDASSSE